MTWRVSPGASVERRLQGCARVVARGLRARTAAALHGERGGLRAVLAEEHVAIRVEARNLRARHAEPQLLERRASRVLAADHAVLVPAHHHVLRVLQVLEVLPVVPLVRQLRVRKQRNHPRRRAFVGDLDGPVLKRLILGNEERRLRANAPVLAVKNRIAKAMANGRRLGCLAVGRHLAVAVPSTQRLANRLPAGAPEVAVGVVSQVEESAGLVLRNAVEAEAQHAAGAAGLVERVAARALRDDAAVEAGAKVVGPRPRGVWAGDHIFARFIIEVAVLHGSPFGWLAMSLPMHATATKRFAVLSRRSAPELSGKFLGAGNGSVHAGGHDAL